MLVAPVGSATSSIAPAVTPIAAAVTPIAPPVTPIAAAVTLIGLEVPFSVSVALVGRVASILSQTVARLTGMLSLRRGLVAQVCSQIASLHRLLTLLRRLRGVSPILCALVGEGSPPLLRPL